MKRLIAGALCCGLAIATQVQAEINKCKGADGKVYFTDKPCPSQTKLESSTLTPEEKREQEWEKAREIRKTQLASYEEERTARITAQREYEESQQKQRFDYLYRLLQQGKITQLELITIQQKGIFIGMSEFALRESWGKPSSINRSGIGGDQWVYSIGPVKMNYAYVEDGKVTNWQTTE